MGVLLANAKKYLEGIASSYSARLGDTLQANACRLCINEVWRRKTRAIAIPSR